VDTAEALAQRIAVASAQDVLLGMVFESSLAHVQERHGAALAEVLRHDVLGGRNLVGFLRYPVVDLLRMVERAGRAPPGGGAGFEGLVQGFGAASVQRFFVSPVGRTMVMLAAGNAQRLLQSAPSAYRAVCSFGQRRYTRTGERSAEFVFEGDLLGPAWHTGVVTEALQSTCDVTPRVSASVQDAAGLNFTLRVAW
jgi:uncharacterized protein (TIGR02265 family)